MGWASRLSSLHPTRLAQNHRVTSIFFCRCALPFFFLPSSLPPFQSFTFLLPDSLSRALSRSHSLTLSHTHTLTDSLSPRPLSLSLAPLAPSLPPSLMLYHPISLPSLLSLPPCHHAAIGVVLSAPRAGTCSLSVQARASCATLARRRRASSTALPPTQRPGSTRRTSSQGPRRR